MAYSNISDKHKGRMDEIHEEYIGPIDVEVEPQTCLNCAHNKESCEERIGGKLVKEVVQCELNGPIYHPATRMDELIYPHDCHDCGWEKS